jgi:hypothetical protein
MMSRLYLAVALVLVTGVPAAAYLLIGAQSVTPPPAFVMSGQTFMATGNNLFQSKGNGTRFSQ